MYQVDGLKCLLVPPCLRILFSFLEHVVNLVPRGGGGGVLHDDLRLSDEASPALVSLPEPLDLPAHRLQDHGILGQGGPRVFHLVRKGLQGLTGLEEDRITLEKLPPYLHLQGVMRGLEGPLLCLKGGRIILRQDLIQVGLHLESLFPELPNEEVLCFNLVYNADSAVHARGGHRGG